MLANMIDQFAKAYLHGDRQSLGWPQTDRHPVDEQGMLAAVLPGVP